MIQERHAGQEHVPPVLIVVCDNTDIAEVFYRKISGETEVEAVTEAECRGVRGRGRRGGRRNRASSRSQKPKRRPSTATAKLFPEFFANTATESTRSASTRSCWPRPRASEPKKRKAGRRRGAAPGRRHRRQAGPARRACPVRRLRGDADRGLGREQRHPHPRASARSAASCSASRWSGAGCAAWTIARPRDRAADRGVRGCLRHSVLGDPVQGSAGEQASARGQAEESRPGTARARRRWKCGSRWWRATPSRSAGT